MKVVDRTQEALHAIPWRLELEPGEVRDRLAWARRAGHPDYLWPEVAPADWRTGLLALADVARSVLAGDDAELWEGRIGARALGVAGYTSGLGPLVGYWIEAGRVRAPEPLRSLFLVHLAHGRARAARQREELERAARVLAGTGARPVVVKSCHTGPAYFPEPGTRPGVDLDLVVDRGSFSRAEAALSGAGYERVARQYSPRKSDWLPPGVERWPSSLEVFHAGSQYAVDLHASLERNFFGVRRVRPGTVEESSVDWPEGGAGVRVLRQPERLVYHALHASEGFHSLTLVRLVELVLMIRRDRASGALDWDEATALLRATGGARFAYPALALAERLAPGTVAPRLLAVLEEAATPALRAIVAERGPATAHRLDVLSVRERFMWCATPGDWVRRLVHMAAPAPAGRSLRRLGGSYLARIRRVLGGRVTFAADSRAERRSEPDPGDGPKEAA